MSIAQYKHAQWSVEDGAPAGILALAQGESGFLWLGTRSGLYRFDGISFQRISRRGEELPAVTALMVSREGDLWVGYATRGSGTAVFRNGVLRSVPMPDSDQIMDFAQTPDGSIWATLGRKVRHLMRYRQGRWIEVGKELGFPDENLGRMIVARTGGLWVSTEKAVWYLQKGSKRFERLNAPTTGFGGVAEDGSGNIWLSDKSGIRAIWSGRRQKAVVGALNYPVPGYRRALKTMFDREGNLWGKTQNGIFRVRSPVLAVVSPGLAGTAVDHYRQKDGLTSDITYAIQEDREGNIWVGTDAGLDKLRTPRVVVEPKLTKRALWGDVLLGARDGSVYIGEADGVYRVKPGGSPELLLRADEPLALCEGGDSSIWIAFVTEVVRFKNGAFNTIKGPPAQDNGISDCSVDQYGDLWIAAARDGMFRLTPGGWHQTAKPPAHGGLPPTALVRRQSGEILVGYDESSLGSLVPPRPIRPIIVARDALGRIRTLTESSRGTLFGSNKGVGLIESGRIHFTPYARIPALRAVAGIAQTPAGETWLIDDQVIASVSTRDLLHALRDPKASVGPRFLDARDGLPAGAGGDTFRAIVRGGDGRLWFSTRAGTVWLAPSRMQTNPTAPPVTIASLQAGGRLYPDPTQIRLPPGTRDMQISYTAPSLSIPERVRVLYSLDGADDGWVSPGMRRQAFYTNLGPGNYVFRVVAANEDGVWNRTGALLTVQIPPTFTQSIPFKILLMIGACLVLWLAYLVRVRHVTARMRTRLEERLAERERIARDLHDTLLQGFQGLIIRFQSVANAIPEDQRARSLIDRTLDSADEILSAGRDSVRHLRASEDTDLARLFSDAADRLRYDFPARFEMVIEGSPRDLHPVVREEVGRIGIEALINAFRHANAGTIELVISYEGSTLGLGVRDDGIGIAPAFTQSGGRQGHFGLVGMRERALEIEAEFSVSTRPSGGTEVSLMVPARVAYALFQKRRWSLMPKRFSSR